MANQVADPERARGRRGHQDLQHARQVLQPQRRLQGTQGSGERGNPKDKLYTLYRVFHLLVDRYCVDFNVNDLQVQGFPSASRHGLR